MVGKDVVFVVFIPPYVYAAGVRERWHEPGDGGEGSGQAHMEGLACRILV